LYQLRLPLASKMGLQSKGISHFEFEILIVYSTFIYWFSDSSN
jgi:hypothetical protein